MTHSVMKFSITTNSIMILSIMTEQHNDTQCYDIQHYGFKHNDMTTILSFTTCNILTSGIMTELHNDTQHHYTQHKDRQNNNIQNHDIHHNNS
jgi:hypothetical protein